MVYEAQIRLAYMYQKRKGISYANLRNRKRIIDAQKNGNRMKLVKILRNIWKSI